jgi:hypothetical protein
MMLGVLAAVSGEAFAGWVIGGGEVIKDTRNPWFIQNTAEVRYCVALDPEHFHQERSVAEGRIREAIDYWKAQFATAINYANGNGLKVEVATQTFVEVLCDGTEDLAFQLGTLSDAQIVALRVAGREPTDLVSTAVRVDYDPVTLKGKGFIYLAADEGPLRPVSTELADRPWTLGDGHLITNVVAHELGHVFGLVHGGWTLAIMSQQYPEYILNRNWAENLANPAYWYLPDYFKLRSLPNSTGELDGRSCIMEEPFAAFFGIRRPLNCFSFRNLTDTSIEVWVSQFPDDDLRKWGTITLDTPSVGDIDWAVDLWLPPGQQVYPENEETAVVRRIHGPLIRSELQHGVYRREGGALQREVLVSRRTNTGLPLRFSGQLDGRWVLDLEFASHLSEEQRLLPR